MPYNFSIVGVQKSGTSTLSGTFSQHRLVCRPPRQGAHFFNDESYDWTHARLRARLHRAASRSRPHDGRRLHAGLSVLAQRARADACLQPGPPADRGVPRPRSSGCSRTGRCCVRATPTGRTGRVSSPSSARRRCPTTVPTDVKPMRYKHMSGHRPRLLRRAARARVLGLRPRRSGCCWSSGRCWRRSTRPSTGRPTTSGCRASRRTRRCATATPGRRSSPGTAPTAADLQSLASLYAADLAVFDRLSGLDTSAWPTTRILAGTLDPGEFAARLATKVAPL